MARASSVVDSDGGMEASLTCAVCLAVFREPVTLPLCSHNFCKSCVQECAEPQPRLLAFPRAPEGGVSGPARVPCPLCRKVSVIHGGISALPVNTTLAELARLLAQPGGGGGERPGAEPCLYRESVAAKQCPDHPEHKMELFCKNCATPCCGKCVSVRHQGIFHNVNLLDMVYQEEKLMFFNSLKKLREVHEKITKEMLDDDKELKDALKKNTDLANSTFDVQKALELKRQQLLDFINQQQNLAMKQHEMQKSTRTHQKVTLENLLKDCESLVDEFEPKSFLQVSCQLNKRIKSSLDLVQLTASHAQNIPKPDLGHVDLQTVLDAISGLQISPSTSNDCLPKGNEAVSFKNINRTWKPEQVPSQKYCPVQNQEFCNLHGQIQKMAIRLLSITEMPEYKHLSFEELRMKYYENSTVQENGASLHGQQGQSASIDVHHFGPTDVGLKTKVKRVAGHGGAFSNVKSNHRPETSSKVVPKLGLGEVPLMNVQTGGVFTFPSVVAVRAKESPSCSSEGASCGVSSDINAKTEAIPESNRAPSFCLGRSDNVKAWRSWRKPKTSTLLPTTESATPLKITTSATNKPLFTFSSTLDSNGSNVAIPFSIPFRQPETTTQENEVLEDHAAQSNSSEEFYDAVSNENSDVEDMEDQALTKDSSSK